MEAAALGTGAADTVATAGRVDLQPNTVNSVPREARRLGGAAHGVWPLCVWAGMAAARGRCKQ